MHEPMHTVPINHTPPPLRGRRHVSGYTLSLASEVKQLLDLCQEQGTPITADTAGQMIAADRMLRASME